MQNKKGRGCLCLVPFVQEKDLNINFKTELP